MFGRTASSLGRGRIPVRLLVVGICLAVLAAFGPTAAAADDPGTPATRPTAAR